MFMLKADYHAEAQGIDADGIVQRLLSDVGEPTPEEHDQLAGE